MHDGVKSVEDDDKRLSSVLEAVILPMEPRFLAFAGREDWAKRQQLLP